MGFVSKCPYINIIFFVLIITTTRPTSFYHVKGFLHSSSPSTSMLSVVVPTTRREKKKKKNIINTARKQAQVVVLAAMSRDDSDDSLSSEESSSSKQQQQRKQDVTFAQPLLDYGYPPAVEDYFFHQSSSSFDESSNNEKEEESDKKPILLYLPGFDGTYICPFIQFPELNTEFEIWCMTIPMDDRSTFDELKQIVLNFINEITLLTTTQEDNTTTGSSESESSSKKQEQSQQQQQQQPSWFNFIPSPSSSQQQSKRADRLRRRPLYIAGESFGGILAAEVALTILKKNKNKSKNIFSPNDLKGLILINAATCYDRSQLAMKGPKIYNYPLPLYIPGLLRLLPLFGDEYSFEQLLLILQSKGLPSVIDNPQREAYMGRVAFSLPTKLEFMPPETLEWRLNQWLDVGCTKLGSGGAASGSSSSNNGNNQRLLEFQNYPKKLPTLIIAGEKDLTLPSIAEAERLANIIPNSQVHVVNGAGHASTCGSRMDMAALLRNRFPDLLLRKKKKQQKRDDDTSNTTTIKRRTAMKEDAANGTGPYFGMTPRYDNANIGLNPILYWSKENYRRVIKTEEIRAFSQPKDDGKDEDDCNGQQQRTYKMANYKVV